MIAASLARPDDLRGNVRAPLVRLAAKSGDSVLMSIRTGIEAVCVDREIGDFPIRANYLDVGSRRPLGVGAGSLALLAWASDEEIAAILPLIKPRLSRYPKLSMRLIEQEIERSRKRGYTLMLNLLVDRMGAVGVPVLGANGQPLAALSIAALSDRISSRLEQLVGWLQEEAENIAMPARAEPKVGSRASPAQEEGRVSYLTGVGLTSYGKHARPLYAGPHEHGGGSGAGGCAAGTPRCGRPAVRLLDHVSSPDAVDGIRRALRPAADLCPFDAGWRCDGLRDGDAGASSGRLRRGAQRPGGCGGESPYRARRRDAAVQTLAQVGHPAYEVPLGATIPAYYALVASRYMHEHGTSEADLAELAVLMRRHAVMHPGRAVPRTDHAWRTCSPPNRSPRRSSCSTAARYPTAVPHSW